MAELDDARPNKMVDRSGKARRLPALKLTKRMLALIIVDKMAYDFAITTDGGSHDQSADLGKQLESYVQQLADNRALRFEKRSPA